MSIVIVATAYPIPEHRDAVIAAFEASIPRAHAEDEGCELYALHEAKDRLVMIEKWSDGKALNAHGSGPAFAELSAALDGKLTAPLDVQVLRARAAGDPAKGQL